MAVTIKDVAKAAGVSHATVSRALRSNPAISAATRLHVKKIADEMGYVPNNAARGLKTSRSHMLGVIVRRIDDPFFSKVLDGIEDVSQAKGYNLLLAASGHDPKKDSEIIASMAESRVEGVIICSKRFDAEQSEKLRKFGIPTVLINDQHGGDGSHSIMHDDAWGSLTLTEHLLELGHTRIAYLGNGNAGVTNQQRQLGYQRALTNAGVVVSPEYIVMGPNGQPGGGFDTAQQLLHNQPPPTGIVCFNDMIAVGAIRAFDEAGLSVPQDCSIVGFDDIDLAAFVTPPLTTFRQPKFEMGRQSAEIILNLVNKQNGASPEHIMQRGELITRQSTTTPKID